MVSDSVQLFYVHDEFGSNYDPKIMKKSLIL